LTAWAGVEGVFRVNGKPAPNVRISLYSRAIESYGPGKPNISSRYVATTDAMGRYAFHRVPAGKVRMGRELVDAINDLSQTPQSSKQTRYRLTAGETSRIDLGDGGRTIVGKLAMPKEVKDEPNWSSALILVSLYVPEFPSEIANEEDPEKRTAMLKAWKATDA